MTVEDKQSRSVTVIRWEKDDCPLNNELVNPIDCETCKYGYLGNYVLKQTLCGYDTSLTTEIEEDK